MGIFIFILAIIGFFVIFFLLVSKSNELSTGSKVFLFVCLLIPPLWPVIIIGIMEKLYELRREERHTKRWQLEQALKETKISHNRYQEFLKNNQERDIILEEKLKRDIERGVVEKEI